METWWEWASKTHSIVRSPHSLGTLIEWKLPQSPRSTFWPTRPHSLGTLIEWKHHRRGNMIPLHFQGPHSLGTLIEWKRIKYPTTCSSKLGPHSLGTLIEWKH